MPTYVNWHNVIRPITLNQNWKIHSPGNSRKLDVLLCRPRMVFWKFNGPISSTESQFDIVDSLEPRLLAKYARPPFMDPLRIGEHGLLTLVERVTGVSSVISVKSDVDFLHIFEDVVVASSSASWSIAEGVPSITSVESSVWLDTMLGDVTRRGELTVEVEPYSFLVRLGDT